MDKDKSISINEAGLLLATAAKKGIDHFVDRVLPKIAEVLNINYSDFDRNNLRTESLYVCLWAATKVLEREKPELIDSIHEAGLSGFEKNNRTEKRELFHRRCNQYNDAWDEKSGGNQSMLCINILGEMFTEGNHQRELVNFWVFIQTTNFVLSLMKAIIDLRNELRIEE